MSWATNSTVAMYFWGSWYLRTRSCFVHATTCALVRMRLPSMRKPLPEAKWGVSKIQGAVQFGSWKPVMICTTDFSGPAPSGSGVPCGGGAEVVGAGAGAVPFAGGTTMGATAEGREPGGVPAGATGTEGVAGLPGLPEGGASAVTEGAGTPPPEGSATAAVWAARSEGARKTVARRQTRA